VAAAAQAGRRRPDDVSRAFDQAQGTHAALQVPLQVGRDQAAALAASARLTGVRHRPVACQQRREQLQRRGRRRRRSTSRLNPMRKRTSSGERFQFSVENAYAEMCFTPISMAPATTSSSDASPAS
jgi:hypothetical protein